ncbi:MAG: GNAT family N-acetyltransferase [Elusimicrobiota bacterium]
MGRSRTPTLRRYRAGDAGGIGTLVERVFREYGLWRDHKNGLQDLRDIPAAYLRPGGEFLVLLAGPRVIGCGGLQVGRRGAAQVQRMYLDRAWRGRGLGRRLLNGLMERAARRGVRRLDLETSLRFQDAIALYLRCGFEACVMDCGGCCSVRMFRKIP